MCNYLVLFEFPDQECILVKVSGTDRLAVHDIAADKAKDVLALRMTHQKELDDDRLLSATSFDIHTGTNRRQLNSRCLRGKIREATPTVTTTPMVGDTFNPAIHN